MFLKILAVFGIAFLLGSGTGLMLELHKSVTDHTNGRILFWKPDSMVVPALVLTVILTLVYTFLTPIGRSVFSALDAGEGAAFVIFGGPMPIPFGAGLLGLMALLFLGGTSAVILLCLLGILVAKVTDRR